MSSPRRPVIAGNWKMHKTMAEARDLSRALLAQLGPAELAAEVVLCPPFTALAAVSESIRGTALRLGAQNMHWQTHGAFTGEIAPAMLVELGVSHVILGHSERRQYFAETDDTVARKVESALAHQLIPIVCVGETLTEREGGLTDNVVIVQVQRALQGRTAEEVAGLVFAYEPVWAIGTGKTCEAGEANRVCGIIRDTVGRLFTPAAAAAVRVQYGGSVKAETIAEQMAQPHIDGALVGGASLEASSFAAIARLGLIPTH
ncbi:MAG: triose-phosphate isomerase [Candidatus Sericytochromatia bacterium]|nr:triose-phosphate isomerase [Candidatus Sericytochromatia bacterium]